MKTFKQPDGLQLVELTALQVVLGSRVAEVELSYVPAGTCLYGDAFQAFLATIREDTDPIETTASGIMNTISKVLKPLWLKVVVRLAPTNGVVTEATALYEMPSGEEMTVTFDGQVIQ